jgi:hypothetical protein
VTLLAEPGAPTAAPRGRSPRGLAGLIAAVGLTCIGAGLGGGIVLGRHTASTSPPVTLLTPSDTGDVGFGSTDPAAMRAIALVVGATRSDGMSFDEWYRARLNRLAPGIRFRYAAGLEGNRVCGYWRVIAGAVPGPVLPSDPPNENDVLNTDGAIASVDGLTGGVVGVNSQTAAVSLLNLESHCSSQPQPGQVAFSTGTPTSTWLDQFRAGAAP